MRITVSVSELIDRLQAYKRRELEAYEQRVEQYPRELAAYRARVLKGLRRDLARLEREGRTPGSYSTYDRGRHSGAVIVQVGAMPPTKPRRPDFSSINRRIKELRLSARDEISIDTMGKDWRGLFHAIEER